MMQVVLLVIATFVCNAVQAQGFALRDLTRVAPVAKATLGVGYADRAAPERLTLTCPTCEGSPMIDILIGRQTDGTEERVRSGQTPLSRLEDLCRAKNPECRITGLDVAPAVGWVSSYRLGATMTGSTAIILLGGDMLTIRSIAGSATVAGANADRLVRALAPSVVGQ